MRCLHQQCRGEEEEDEVNRRMKRVGPIHGFIIPGYDALHSQSREHVTEDVLGALSIWEQKQGVVA